MSPRHTPQNATSLCHVARPERRRRLGTSRHCHVTPCMLATPCRTERICMSPTERLGERERQFCCAPKRMVRIILPPPRQRCRTHERRELQNAMSRIIVRAGIACACSAAGEGTNNGGRRIGRHMYIGVGSGGGRHGTAVVYNHAVRRRRRPPLLKVVVETSTSNQRSSPSPCHAAMSQHPVQSSINTGR